MLFARARRYLTDAGRAIEHAPVEVAIALFVAILFSWAVEQEQDPAMMTWLESTIAALLVLAFAWTGTLLHALGAIPSRTRWLITLAGVAVVAPYAYWVMDLELAAEGWRAGLLLVAAVLWLLGVPALGTRGDAVERMRRVDGRILLRLFGVLIYATALYAGLALALGAINTLFELDVRAQVYAHVAGWIFFLLVPWVVLGGIDDYVRPPEATSAVASAVQPIILFLVPPLLALYLLILYAYVVRIALTGELPQNLVSPMVLAAGGLAAIALLQFDPQPHSPGLPRALRLGPTLFLPLAPLGVWALLLRIEQYGWTEFRALRVVVLAAFTALAAAATVQLLRRRPFALHVLPITLAAVTLLAVVGPWSTLALARRSQALRLEAAIDSLAGVPVDSVQPTAEEVRSWAHEGPTPPGAQWRTVSAATYDRVRNGARYLHTHFGADALPAALRERVRSDEPWRVNYAAVLGLRRATERGQTVQTIYRTLPLEIAVPLAGATAYRIDWRPPAARGRGAPATMASADSARLIVQLRTGTVYVDLAPLFAAADLPVVEPRRNQLPAANAVLEVRDAAGQPRGQFLVIESTLQGAGKDRLQNIAGVLLVR